jgi:hypothetical protein
MGKFLEKYIEQFHQDILTINDSIEGAIREALGALSLHERNQLRIELEEIALDSNIKFVNMWNNSDSPFRLRNELGARETLDKILAALDCGDSLLNPQNK